MFLFFKRTLSRNERDVKTNKIYGRKGSQLKLWRKYSVCLNQVNVCCHRRYVVSRDERLPHFLTEDGGNDTECNYGQMRKNMDVLIVRMRWDSRSTARIRSSPGIRGFDDSYL